MAEAPEYITLRKVYDDGKDVRYAPLEDTTDAMGVAMLWNELNEPEPVGHWIKTDPRPRSWVYICSECHEVAYFPKPRNTNGCRYKFCPWCGVEMDTEQKIIKISAKLAER